MVVTDGETGKLFPVPTRVPPHEPVYHLRVVPLPPVAVSTEVPPGAQIATGLALAEVGATAGTSSVTVIEAQPEEPHELL